MIRHAVVHSAMLCTSGQTIKRISSFLRCQAIIRGDVPDDIALLGKRTLIITTETYVPPSHRYERWTFDDVLAAMEKANGNKVN